MKCETVKLKKDKVFVVPLDEFKEAVKISLSYSGILRNLGIFHATYVNYVKERIIKDGIDISHFKTVKPSKRLEFWQLFKNNSKRISDGKNLRKKLMAIHNTTKCSNESCRTKDCSKLTLHVDHINGNNQDGRLENLRLLCPNCHSETKTNAGANLGISNKCSECKFVSIGHHGICIYCRNKNSKDYIRSVEKRLKSKLKYKNNSNNEIKIMLIKCGIMENVCKNCPYNYVPPEEKMLHLDHINGDNKDYRLENLRFLCWNCHSRTGTYCMSEGTSKNYCVDCGNKVKSTSERCEDCYKIYCSETTIRKRDHKNIKCPTKNCKYMMLETSRCCTMCYRKSHIDLLLEEYYDFLDKKEKGELDETYIIMENEKICCKCKKDLPNYRYGLNRKCDECRIKEKQQSKSNGQKPAPKKTTPKKTTPKPSPKEPTFEPAPKQAPKELTPKSIPKESKPKLVKKKVCPMEGCTTIIGIRSKHCAPCHRKIHNTRQKEEAVERKKTKTCADCDKRITSGNVCYDCKNRRKGILCRFSCGGYAKKEGGACRPCLNKNKVKTA